MKHRAPATEESEGSIAASSRKNFFRPVTGLRVLIVLLWLTSTAWLIRFEAFPHFFTRTLQGYQSVLPADVLVADSWMNLKLDGQPAGYSHYSIQTEEIGNETYYVITNTMELGLKIMGQGHRMEMENSARIDLGYRLQEFSSSVTSTTFAAEISAEHLGDGTYNATLSYKGGRQSRKLTIPKDTVVFSPMTGLNLRNLRAGRKIGLRIFDPITMQPALITLVPQKQETITVEDKQYRAMVVNLEYRGTIFTAWIDTESGELLRQTTPFGLTMQKCAPENAFLATTNAAVAPELLQSLGKRLINGGGND